MLTHSLSNLSDRALEHDLHAAVSRESTSTAALLGFLGEFQARRLFVPAAFASMHEYCVQVLHLSEDSAHKRLQAARAARDFPPILAAVADGRLHLSAVVMLAPRLTARNADELIAASSHKSKSQIQIVLAERFPRPDVPARIRHAAAGGPTPATSLDAVAALAPGQVDHAPHPLSRVAPLSPGRHEVRFTFSEGQLEKLRLAQCLLGRAVPSGAIEQVFEQALDALIDRQEKPMLAVSARSRPRRGTTGNRYVPAAVRREVLMRDGRQCTFVSESGRRCSACRRLDFDHVVPVARGGDTTAGNLRLLCPAHNQLEADRVFGAGFMEEKRSSSRARGRAEPPLRNSSGTARRDATLIAIAPGQVHSDTSSHVDELVPYLLALRFRKDEARRGAEMCEDMAGASLEERMKVALQGLGRARFERCTQPATPSG